LRLTGDKRHILNEFVCQVKFIKTTEVFSCTYRRHYRGGFPQFPRFTFETATAVIFIYIVWVAYLWMCNTFQITM